MNKDYFITSCGRVWSYKSNRFLTPYFNQDGYKRIKIKGVDCSVHRLVALKYIPNPNNYDTVDHIDGNKGNNCVNNLQWLSNKQNIQKATGIKVRCIETNEVYNSMADASRAMGKNPASLSNAFNKGRNYCGGYHWEVIK